MQGANQFSPESIIYTKNMFLSTLCTCDFEWKPGVLFVLKLLSYKKTNDSVVTLNKHKMDLVNSFITRQVWKDFWNARQINDECDLLTMKDNKWFKNIVLSVLSSSCFRVNCLNSNNNNKKLVLTFHLPYVGV